MCLASGGMRRLRNSGFLNFIKFHMSIQVGGVAKRGGLSYLRM